VALGLCPAGRRQPDEQQSTLRRLYAYAVLLVAALGVLFALLEALSSGVRWLGGEASPAALIRPLVAASVGGLVWLAHWRIFGADREAVEQSGANATLRRWYLALMLWVSLAIASFGAGALAHALIQRYAFGAVGSLSELSELIAAMLGGLLIWLPHERWSRRLIRSPGPLQGDELGATLRQVYAALVVTLSLVAALTGLTALLAALLRAALGAATLAGALAVETRGVAALLVALPLLAYYWEQLAATARLSRAEERVGTARRLVSYLTEAVSLAALYVGLGGLIGTLMRLGLGADTLGDGWRTPLSWYVATAMVALPTYGLVSWRSEARLRGSPEEERALARRIYLYAALLFGVVATVTAATLLIRLLVVALLGQADPGWAGEIGRLAGYAALGAMVGVGYGALLRRAGAARGEAGRGRTIVLVADGALRKALEAAFARELPGAAVAAFGEGDSPERRAALDVADTLVLTLAAAGDPALAAFRGRRLLLATPVPGATLIGARYGYGGLAREASRAARAGPERGEASPLRINIRPTVGA